jgi:urea transport system ATP-binding protein
MLEQADDVVTQTGEIAEEIGLKEDIEIYAGLLSHSQKQWLEIGMPLMQDPELLMLDEPIAGIEYARTRTDR